MDEQDERAAELEQPLYDLEAAQRLADKYDGLPPEAEADLRGFAATTNRLARQAARSLNLPYGLRFAVHAIIRYEEGHEEAVEAWMNADDPGSEREAEAQMAARETLVGYKLVVTPVSRERLERCHRDRRRREAALVADRALRVRRPRGPRRRGAGRPGHRSRPRANSPPAGDDDPADPEPDQLVAARQTLRAVCRWWGRR